jgi:hypothetical protein
VEVLSPDDAIKTVAFSQTEKADEEISKRPFNTAHR